MTGNDQSLKGQRAVVTGGGRGIGQSIASHLHRAGAQVIITGRDAAVLASAAAGVGSAWRAMDVSDEASVIAAFAEIGPVDILVNNAGSVSTAPFAKLTLDNWRRTIDVNLTGSFLCSRAVLPGMVERSYGRIVNIASAGGFAAYKYVAAYIAAKHGVIGLTRALALETATQGITVNAVCPGYSDTEMVQRAITTVAQSTGRSSVEAKAALLQNNPQGRLVDPDEIAETVLWLCQEGSRSITGQSIVIAGGEVMH